MRKFMSAFILVLALVGGGVGCGASPNSVEDGDRQLVHQSVQASALAATKLKLAISLLLMDAPNVAEAVKELRLIDQPISDVHANTEQLAANFGPPKEPKDYSPEASAAARDQSKKEHSTKGLLAWIGGALVAALGGLKLVATYLPGVARFFAGPWGAAAETAVAFIDKLRRDGKVTPADLAYLKKLQEDERVQPFVKELAKKVEATVGSPPPATTPS